MSDSKQAKIQAFSDQLAWTHDLKIVRDAAAGLGTLNGTAFASAQPSFRSAINGLIRTARGGDETGRLTALAIIGRISKQLRKPFDSGINKLLSEPMAPLLAPAGSLSDPGDREYLAIALSLIQSGEQVEYLAYFVASEATAKSEARREAAAALLRQSQSLTHALDLLGAALAQQPHETIDKGSTRARRLTWSLESVLDSLLRIDPDVDLSVGPGLVQLMRRALGRDQIGERVVSVRLAIAALDLLAGVVRLHFSLARHAKTFGLVGELYRLFAPARWPDETAESRKTLANLVFEAIVLMAELGLTDSDLRALFARLLGEPVSEPRLRRYAQSAPAITDGVRHWLSTGTTLKSGRSEAAVAESVLQAVERDLAEAFREAAALGDAMESENEILAELTRASPSHAAALRIIVTRTRRVVSRVLLVAGKREFRLSGEIGSSVEYRPVDHESDTPLEGVRVVRIVAPLVERELPSGMRQLVLKAKVEPR